MAHEDPLALLLHVGDAFATLYRYAPGFEARSNDRGWAISAGESHGVFNWAAVTDASPASQATLRAFVGHLRERRIEGLTCYPPGDSAALADTFRDLGLDEPFVVPLMVRDAVDLPPLASTDVTVERLTAADTAMLPEAVAALSAGFDVPPDQTARVIVAPLLGDPTVGIYLARKGGIALGGLAATRFGDMVSIDLVAVDPAAQRQGIGGALMLGAMHEQLTAGATGFHLISSPDGQRLYDRLGFTTLLETHVRFIPLDPIPA